MSTETMLDENLSAQNVVQDTMSEINRTYWARLDAGIVVSKAGLPLTSLELDETSTAQDVLDAAAKKYCKVNTHEKDVAGDN